MRTRELRSANSRRKRTIYLSQCMYVLKQKRKKFERVNGVNKCGNIIGEWKIYITHKSQNIVALNKAMIYR